MHQCMKIHYVAALISPLDGCALVVKVYHLLLYSTFTRNHSDGKSGSESRPILSRCDCGCDCA
jgi:hypothetical protein